MPVRREDGISLVEVLVASALAMAVLAGVLGTLTVSYRTQVFAQREAEALDDARTATIQLHRDLQGATALTIDPSCPTTCLVVSVRNPQRVLQTVRYRLVGSRLVRDRYDPGTGTYVEARTLIDRLYNAQSSVPLFTCVPSSSLLTITVRMVVKPGGSTGTFRIDNTIRPRNSFQKPANCV